MGKRSLITGGVGRVLGMERLAPGVTGTSRMGDSQHCFADVTQARRGLEYELDARGLAV